MNMSLTDGAPHLSSVWPISASVAALHDASSQLTALTLITDTMNEPTSPLHPSQGSVIRRVTLSDRVVRALFKQQVFARPVLPCFTGEGWKWGENAHKRGDSFKWVAVWQTHHDWLNPSSHFTLHNSQRTDELDSFHTNDWFLLWRLFFPPVNFTFNKLCNPFDIF